MNTETAFHLVSVDFDPFADGEIERIVLSNESQREIWLSCKIGGMEASCSYNESLSLRLAGTLDVAAIKRALQEVVLRHEALRCTFSADGKQICIYPTTALSMVQEDLSYQDAHTRETYLKQYHQQDATTPFDLQNGPLFRVALFKLSAQAHVLTLTAHHIICDGWSFGIILEDISGLYSAYTQGLSPKLPQPIGMGQYALEMQAFAESLEYRETAEYWLDQYQGQVPQLDIPVDRTRPRERTFKSQRDDYPLDSGLVTDLKNMGAAAGSSLVTTLLAAFEVYLYRITGQTDIVLGLPTAGQSATGNFNLVGHCVNLLPLRSKPNGETPFIDYLKLRKSKLLSDYDYQQFTFGTLLQKLAIKRDHSRVPLVPVVFNIDMGMDAKVSFHGITHQLVSNPREYENFELFLNATGTEESLLLEWSYNTQLFDASTIKGMMDEFSLMLRTLVDRPQTLLKDIELTSESKSGNSLPEANHRKTEYPYDAIFTTLIHEITVQNPKKSAVIFGDKQITYEDLDTQSNQLAHFLIQQGIKTGDVIGLAVSRSIDMVIALLGIVKSGAAYLPLDPEYPIDRIEFMLSDSSAKLLLTEAKYKGYFRSQAEETVIEDIRNQLLAQPTNYPDIAIDGNDLAYVLYTSGSTGKPKGVQIEHHSLTNFLLSIQKKPGIGQEDVLLAITTISFDIAGLELYLPLLSGAVLLLADTETARDGRALLKMLRDNRVTIMQATPATWRMMLDAGWNEPIPLKALCGGEAFPADLAERLLKSCSAVWNMYGPTETTIWSTIKQVRLGEVGAITIGKPIANTRIYILDPQLRPVVEGGEGEIYIAGDGVARGYLNRPGLTAEKFVSDLTNPNTLMYATGDVGKLLPTGEYQCFGRVDQQIKIRGHRIELGEIEYHLSQQDAIKEAVVTAREDVPGSKRLVAYIIPQDEGEDEQTAVSWKDKWDNIYSLGVKSEEGLDIADQNLDTAIVEQLGSQGESLKEQTAEWLNQSAERIKALSPRRILEVGSGAGHLLFELAPTAQSYIATDYAETAIAKLNEKLALAPQRWSHVSAHVAGADDFSKVPVGSLDLVLIHSVAQYFPDDRYFTNVISQAAERIDRGCIFIGDIQGKNTLPVHHAADQLFRSGNETKIGDFKKIVANRLRLEDELTMDPGYFYLLPSIIPGITGVDIQLRKGEYLNEITKYHYDVWLFVGTDHTIATPDLICEWNPSLDIADVLSNNHNRIIQLQSVPNLRTTKDLALNKLLGILGDDEPLHVLKAKISTMDEFGIHPNNLWRLGDLYGFNVHIRWTSDGCDGTFEAIFVPISLHSVVPEAPAGIPLKFTNINDFVRNPNGGNTVIAKDRIAQWKKQLKESLPAYMIPDDWVSLTRFPLTANNKIDRKALPKPERENSEHTEPAKQPSTTSEKIIAKLWTDILKLQHISITDDFFELGGHSLLAVEVMTRLEKETGIKLPLASLFKHPTIVELAKLIDGDTKEIKWDCLVPIKPTGEKPPIYIVHGAGLNVLLFNTLSAHLAKDQPIYGLQARGLNGEDEPFTSIPEMASHYISEIMEQNPHGPYALSGFSLGGLIAYEMAKQLLEMGKEVKMLAMFDTYAYETDKYSSWYIKYPQRLFTFSMKGLHSLYLLMKDPKGTFKYKSRRIKRMTIQKYWQITGKDDDVVGFFGYLNKIDKINSKAMDDYVLEPIAVKIHLFRAMIHRYYLKDFKYLGWKKYAKKGVEIHNIPGEHNKIFAAPNDREFGKILQQALDNT